MQEHDSTPWVQAGSLYVVASPIGHLGDLSTRAAGVLASVDYVACEDTRTSRPLLARIGSSARVLPAHQHNEASAAARIVALLGESRSVALLSDAGTPAISDPGARIVSSVIDAGFTVVPVPGPSALTALACASGMIEGAFRFEGFLPARPKARQNRLALLARSDCPVVIFEAPHRIAQTFESISEACGPQRWLFIGRELTKKFEELHRCRAGETGEWLAANPMRTRGEYALIIAPADWTAPSQAAAASGSTRDAGDASATDSALQDEASANIDVRALIDALVVELGASRTSRIVERLTGRPHKEIYAQAVASANELKGLDPGGGA